MESSLNMVITDIIVQSKNSKRYNVYIDCNYSFSASYDEIVEFGIKKGSILTEEDFQNLILNMQSKKAMLKSLLLLSIRPRSRFEIQSRLKSLNFDSTVIEKVLTRLDEMGYINDRQFSDSWIDSSMNFNPVGRRKISSSLKEKGVDPQVIEDALNDSGLNDLDIAIELVKKKLRLSQKVASNQDDTKKLCSKLYRYLLYRGIDYDTAKKAVNICLDCNQHE